MCTVKTGFTPKKEMSEKTYYERKSKGICVRCGKVPARDGKCMCQDCADKSRKYTEESRSFYKAQGICPRCGKNKLFDEEKSCPECLAKAVERTLKSDAKRIDKVKKYRQEYWKRRKKELIEKNICTSCLTRQRAEGHAYCSICLVKHRERQKQKGKEKRQDFLERSERPSYGFCYTCGAKLDRDGKLCSKCAETMTNNLPKTRNNKNHVWRKSNNIAFRKETIV